MASITWILILTTLYKTFNAQPKSFTDDPFIDDEKFTEKGNRAVIHLTPNLSCFFRVQVEFGPVWI